MKSEPKKIDLCACVCVCVCARARTSIYIYIHIYTYIYIHIHTHTHTHTHTHIYIYIYIIPIHFEAVNVVMYDSGGMHVLHLNAILESQYPSVFAIRIYPPPHMTCMCPPPLRTFLKVY
jgi:hypothetical protein